MLRVEKRSRFQIYFDVLQLLLNESSSDNLSLTRVAHKANLPYDRFRSHLNYLIQMGMVSGEGTKLVVTKKGLEYIEGHQRTIQFLKHMGFSP